MVVPGGGSKRGRPIDPYVDEALRTATLEVISRAGWRGATIERIAERAGVARTTIYRRHGSVHGVLLLLMDELYSRAPVPDTGSLRGDLVQVMRVTAASWRDPAHVDFLCAVMAAQRENTELGEAYRAQFAVRRAASSLMLTRAKARGELRPDVDGALLLDCLSGLFAQCVLFGGETVTDLEKRIVRIVDTLLPAFVVSPTEPAA